MANELERMLAALKSLDSRSKVQQQYIDQLMALQKAATDAPKWIEQLPGRRVPFHAPINLSITADSTSQVTGTYSVTEDGPFVVTGIAAFFKKTSGAYAQIWGHATASCAKISQVSQQHGYQYLYDQPNLISGDIAITDRGSDRKWESADVSSALYSPEGGGAYVLPISCLFARNSVIEVAFTPNPSIPYTGTVQIILLGYKIVQGANYQP